MHKLRAIVVTVTIMSVIVLVIIRRVIVTIMMRLLLSNLGKEKASNLLPLLLTEPPSPLQPHC